MSGYKKEGDLNLSEQQVYGILGTYQQQNGPGGRVNKTAIARKYNCSRTSVDAVIRRNRLGLPMIPKTRNRENTGTTEEQDEQILELINENPFTPATRIHADLQLACSVNTVRRRLKEADRSAYRPSVKQYLKENHKRGRLNWAQLNNNTDWNEIIFSDESCVTSCERGQIFVRRPRGTRYDPAYIAEKRESGRVSVSVWSFMSSNGLGGLVRIQGHLNGASYINILRQNMVPFLQANPDKRFQHDLSPIHTSGAVRNYLAESNINVFGWSAKMPDMNPIEHVWARLKTEGPWNVRNSDELWDEISAVWLDLQANEDLITNLYNSMPRRVELLIANNGNWTHY